MMMVVGVAIVVVAIAVTVMGIVLMANAVVVRGISEGGSGGDGYGDKDDACKGSGDARDR